MAALAPGATTAAAPARRCEGEEVTAVSESDPTRPGRFILIGVMAFYGVAVVSLTILTWGALADWGMGFAASTAVGVAMILFGLWTVWRLTALGMLPRWVAAFCCGGVIGLSMMAMARQIAQPLPDPQEQAKWEAELGWYAPTMFALGLAMVLAGLLLYLRPVGRYLAYERALRRMEAGLPPESDAPEGQIVTDETAECPDRDPTRS
jgi:hypothetical protein